MDKAFSCINNNLTLQNSKVKYLEIMRFCQDVNLLLSQLNYQNILYKTIYIIMERKFFAEKKTRIEICFCCARVITFDGGPSIVIHWIVLQKKTALSSHLIFMHSMIMICSVLNNRTQLWLVWLFVANRHNGCLQWITMKVQDGLWRALRGADGHSILFNAFYSILCFPWKLYTEVQIFLKCCPEISSNKTTKYNWKRFDFVTFLRDDHPPRHDNTKCDRIE